MSVIILQAKVKPRWAETATRITLAKLLAKLADKTTTYATVYNFENVSYVIIREKCGETIYVKMPQGQWDLADHVISTPPMRCVCSICDWRRKRSRYLTPDVEFAHIR